MLEDTYKVSLRGHTDEDKVIADAHLLPLRSLFGSRMYGPPAGFSYTKASCVSHCFLEGSVPDFVLHFVFPDDNTSNTHTFSPALLLQISISLYLSPAQLASCMFLNSTTIFIFPKDKKMGSRQEY